MKKIKDIFKISDFKSLLVYWVYFAAAFIYWEILIKVVTDEFIGGKFYFLCFVPAEAMFFAFLEGWMKEKANRIFMPVILTVISIYYAVQVGYYKIFGSLFSVSMLGMGNDAVADFGWTTKAILIDSIGLFVLVFQPVIVSVIIELLRLFPKEKYSVKLHLCSLPITAAMWFLGIGVLMLGGTSRQSAYYAFSNSLMDTDSTSQKLGASVTTLLETGSYIFGIGGNKDKSGILNPGKTDTLLGDLNGKGNNSGSDIILSTTENNGAKEPATDETTSKGGEDTTEPTTEPSQGEEPVKEPERHILKEIDFAELSKLTDDAAVKTLCNYYSGVEGTKKNDFSGMFEGYNLIYICAESFWTYAVNEKVTPTLYKIANNGIVLDNYYNSFKNTTTNGEFAFLTSLWPDVSRDAMRGTDVGSFPQSAKKYMPYGLGNISADLGYNAYGYHNYKGSYYKRNESLPNLGLTCKFMNSGMKFKTAWPSSDLEMMQQSVDDYINDDKFVVYYMTFSGHGAYNDGNYICAKNHEEANALTEGMGLNDQAICYLSCNIELDKAIEYLLDRLEAAGKLENTLIVLTGDHYPYYLTANTRKSLAGHSVDDKFGMYKSTCIIYNAGVKEPIHSSTYCSNVDILPTVLNLLNIPYDSRMIAGTDIFSDGFHKAVLYNKSFITDMVKYNAANGKAEWLTDVSDYSKEELDAYIEAVSNMINREYAASLHMMDCDFYRFVWENSGLKNFEP